MYTPAHYRETDLPTLHAWIRQNNFGLLLSQGPEGIEASHLPFLLEPERASQGVLVTHLARANAQRLTLEGEHEVLAIFSGPHAYVSPSWYVSPEGVPTWNYVAIHAYGRARLMRDEEELHQALVRLVKAHEGGRPEPWSIERLREDYYAGRLKGIVGVEIEITRLVGKKKLSQNRSREDQGAVATALQEQGDDLSQAVARMMLEQLERG